MQKHLLPIDYYNAARKLLPEMDEAMRQVVEELLKRAEAGEKVDNRLVEIVTENKVLRKKYRDALELGDENTMGYSPLAGGVNSPNARKFICPVPGHNYINRIQKVGEDPGMCPMHNLALIPFDQKGGQ
jgi:hypothetical protein